MQQMKAIGIDYCYAYTWITGDTQTAKANDGGAAQSGRGRGAWRGAQRFRRVGTVTMG